MRKNFVWSDSNGELRAVSFYYGVCDLTCDPENPSTTHPYALELRTEFITRQGLAACHVVECSCDPAVYPTCDCAPAVLKSSYVENGVLTPKPTMTPKLDGVAFVNGARQDKTPGATASFTVECGAPDGHQVEFRAHQAAITQDAPVVLTFTNGVSNGVTVTAPAQGLSGALVGRSKYIGELVLLLRGWA